MANIQKQLEVFHKNIKVESSELREKRDIILNKIRKSLSEDKKPIPEVLNQGSYIYGVGIKPVSEEDYDIDVGLDFNIKSSDYNAEAVRKWVYDAIKKHTDKVQSKGPCIRVIYQIGYHVDLVCYARYKDNDLTENFQLAHKNGLWMPSDPKKIKYHIQKAREKFKDTKDSSGSDQLQRIVRYFKRWNDLMIVAESNDKPIGLAILLYCIETLPFSTCDSKGDLDDLQALIIISEKAKHSTRICVKKPDTEEDVFSKISEKGMTELIIKFHKLYEALLNARNSDCLEDACKIMREQFGDDFPLEKNDEDKNKTKASLLSATVSSYSTSFKPYGQTK